MTAAVKDLERALKIDPVDGAVKRKLEVLKKGLSLAEKSP